MTERTEEAEGQSSYPQTGTASYAFVHAGRSGSQAAFLFPHLQPGMSLLDCGCGPGTITADLARLVAPGEVVGIDVEAARIEQAREHAGQEGVANVRFEVANVYELPFPDNSFDAAFENTLFQHLKDPVTAAKEVLRVLKPGGVFGAKDQSSNGNLCAGMDPEMIAAIDTLYTRWNTHRGADFTTGYRLRSILHDAGFERTQLNAGYGSAGTPDAMKYVSEVHSKLYNDDQLKATAIELGWADEAFFARMKQAVADWGENPGSFWAVARCEALGWKPEA
jgi:ubiquinone/menaquinone biosynthesis C-methylase UbiE